MVINCKRLKNSPIILKFWEVYDLTQPNEFPEFGCDLELLNDDDAMALFLVTQQSPKIEAVITHRLIGL